MMKTHKMSFQVFNYFSSGDRAKNLKFHIIFGPQEDCTTKYLLFTFFEMCAENQNYVPRYSGILKWLDGNFLKSVILDIQKSALFSCLRYNQLWFRCSKKVVFQRRLDVFRYCTALNQNWNRAGQRWILLNQSSSALKFSETSTHDVIFRNLVYARWLISTFGVFRCCFTQVPQSKIRPNMNELFLDLSPKSKEAVFREESVVDET